MAFEHWLTTPKEWYRLRPIAQARRRYPTPQLEALWERLRRRQIHRLEFRRQEAIGSFLADFFSYGARLAIVVETPDLSGHLQPGALRTRCLEELGVLELRFSAERVDEDIDGVVASIAEVADRRRRRGYARGPGRIERSIGESLRSARPDGDEHEMGWRERRIVVRRSVDGRDSSVSEPVEGYERWQSTKRQWRRMKSRARELRQGGTMAERYLWKRLRGRQLGGLEFRRQHVIGTMIVDFYCASIGLVIEVDGDVHDTAIEHDGSRDVELSEQGLTIIHVANDDVLDNVDAVAERILAIATALRVTDLSRHQPIGGDRR